MGYVQNAQKPIDQSKSHGYDGIHATIDQALGEKFHI